MYCLKGKTQSSTQFKYCFSWISKGVMWLIVFDYVNVNIHWVHTCYTSYCDHCISNICHSSRCFTYFVSSVKDMSGNSVILHGICAARSLFYV